MEIKYYIKIAILMLVFSCGLVPKSAFATFTLSVKPNPYRGSDDLRFETIDPTAGSTSEVLKIDINSDLGLRYELTQTLLTPLTNQAQGVVISDSNFIFYARQASAYGTLNYVEQDTAVTGVRNIYISNDTGTSDSFELVYAIKTPLDVAPGLYWGRLLFVLRPIGTTTQPPVNRILNIIAQVGRGESTVEISTAIGGRVIALNPGKENMGSVDMVVNIKGSLGSQFRLLQQLPEPLISTAGEELPFEAVNFVVQDVRKGSPPSGTIPLSSRLDEIYKSGPRGEAETFVITYNLGDLTKFKAGRYKTNLKYFLEQSIPAQTKLIDTFPIEVQIEPVFDLIVKTEVGTGTIEFRNLNPREPTKPYEVLIEIKNNTAKQYQVTQNMASELTSKEGQIIPQKYFTLRTESVDTKGILKFTDRQEVKKGDSVLFISDKQGSPDKFKVIYELNVPAEVKAGDYSTSVAYSLSEI